MVADEFPSRWIPIKKLRPIAYPPEKAIVERQNNPGSYFLYRPLSWPITFLAVGLRISPLLITVVSLLVTVAGLAMIISGSFVMGAILLNVAMVLDQVDGNVARATRRSSLQGARLDSLVGLLYTSLTPWASGTAILFSSPNGAVVGSLPESAVVAIVFSGTVAIMVRKLMVEIATRTSTLGMSTEDRQEVRSNVLSSSPVAYLGKLINSFALIFLLLSAVAGLTYEFMLIYSVYHAVLLVVVVGLILRAEPRSSETGPRDTD